jgi:hypothetical protein
VEARRPRGLRYAGAALAVALAGATVVAGAALGGLAGCAGLPPALPAGLPPLAEPLPALPFPPVRFAVLTDPHLFDPSLGAGEPAFLEHEATWAKMFAESGEILEAAVDQLLQERARPRAPGRPGLDFVLVCGDLTKDGELACHLRVRAELERLEESGLPVYVIPGNHDIWNTGAVRYQGATSERVPTISPAEFADLYAEMGYREAFDRDPASLSYACEPAPGLWLLALDSCCYWEDRPPSAMGRLRPETILWADRLLRRAAREGRAVVAMVHHQVVEHFPTQMKYLADNVLEDEEVVWPFLAERGLRVVFTGHEHAHDVAVKPWPQPSLSPEPEAPPPGLFLFDVSTGALCCPPCAFRLVEALPGGELSIESRYVRSIPSHPQGFPEYARSYLQAGLARFLQGVLRGYLVCDRSARLLSAQMARIYLAHMIGDERPPAEPVDLKGVGLWGRLVIAQREQLLAALSVDLDPPDHDVVLDLRSGGWRPLR